LHPCRDSFSGMAVILEMLAHRGRSVSQIMDELPRFFIARGKLPIRSEAAPAIIRHLRQRHAPERINLLDGLFINLDHGWVHVRRSNTESVMRVTAEAESPEAARALVDTYLGMIQEVLPPVDEGNSAANI